METARLPQVPLEAGLGPDNPPCPACGEPLFGWARMRPGAVPVRRCERCGLGVAGERASRQEALAALGPAPARVPNAASFQARLGGSGWAGLERDRRILFTVESLGRLGVAQGRPRADIAAAWQTLLNSFTFGHNVALGRLGRSLATPAPSPWQRRVDAAVSVLAAPVVMIGALLLEGAAALAGRGGAIQLDDRSGRAQSNGRS